MAFILKATETTIFAEPEQKNQTRVRRFPWRTEPIHGRPSVI